MASPDDALEKPVALDETLRDNKAAIDFGTTYCSLAFSAKGDKIRTVQLNPNQDRVPTALLLKKKGDNSVSIVAIGFVAQELYQSLRSSEYDTHLYFECFKMCLRDEEKISRKTTIHQSYYLIEVISLLLQRLKIEFERHLNTSSYHGLTSNDFAWVITVPAIWKGRSKQMMREAAYRAGLLSADVPPITTLTLVGQPLKIPDMRHCAHKLTLALEPECAALYCQQLTDDMVASYCDPVITDATSKCYMVIDIGGGTVDIAIHKVEESNTISSVIPPTGNEWGGMKVNDSFAELLQIVVGDPKFERFCTKPNRKAVHEATIKKHIFHEFELRKRHFGDSKSNENACINIRLDPKFINFYGEDVVTAGVQALEDDRIQFEDDVLSIHFSKIDEIFAQVAAKIIECVDTASAKVDTIDTAYLVGGFGGCRYLYTKLKEALVKNCPGIHVIVPRDYKLAVVKGAVIYRENPGIVGSRVSDAYYGVQTTGNFDPEKHELFRKWWNSELKGFKCYYVFDSFIEKGQVVKFSETFTKSSYTPLSALQTTTSFPIYRTLKDGVQYTKDSKGYPVPGVECIGRLTIETPACGLPLEERNIECTLHLGGTELKVTALYVPTGKKLYAAFDFLS